MYMKREGIAGENKHTYMIKKGGYQRISDNTFDHFKFIVSFFCYNNQSKIMSLIPSIPFLGCIFEIMDAKMYLVTKKHNHFKSHSDAPPD